MGKKYKQLKDVAETWKDREDLLKGQVEQARCNDQANISRTEPVSFSWSSKI